MKCPACGSSRVYPSRLRNLFERARHWTTGKQPHRCHGCGWRKWRESPWHGAGEEVHPDDLRIGRQSPPVSPKDLDQLDTSTSTE